MQKLRKTSAPGCVGDAARFILRPMRPPALTRSRLDPARFNLKTLPKRFETLADPLAGALGAGVDMGRALAAIEERIRTRGEEE